MSSLPFTIRGACGGFVDLEGIARLEGAELALEFRTVHPLSEFFSSVPPKEVRVAVRDLEEAAFERRLWLGYLHLRARSMNASCGCAADARTGPPPGNWRPGSA